MNKYYSLLLSPNMSLSTEGYLICINVPICRSGYQDYFGHELEGMPGWDKSWNLDPNKIYKVYRPPKEVLDPDTIASFEGKSVVDTHPTSEGNVVHIDNERYLNCGHIQNVRRGEDYQGEVTLQADVWIKDPQLREKVRPILDPDSPTAIRDVSCGYTLTLVRINGRIEVRKIRGNHLAVVEKGRAGPGIAIRDSAPLEIKQTRSKTMPLLDRIFGTGLKQVVADATPEELLELQRNINGSHSVTPAVVPQPVPPAVAKPAVDAEPEKKNPHAIAAHHCLGRCLAALGTKDKMGVDAFGAPVSISILAKELGRYIGDEEMTDKAAMPDEKCEELADATPEPAKPAGDGEEEAMPDAMTPPEPGPAADYSINNLGESVLHQADKAANDAVRSNIKALKPIISGFLAIPKKDRTQEQQVAIDSYNSTVKAINANKGNAYSGLAKVKHPSETPQLIPVAADAVATEDVSRFYEGVPYAIGKRRHDEYIAQKGKK